MKTTPRPLNRKEWLEIWKNQDVRNYWYIHESITARDLSGMMFAAHFDFDFDFDFDFVSREPGYAGDLYILIGDRMEPLVLARDEAGGMHAVEGRE
jgi:hypothetical protein